MQETTSQIKKKIIMFQIKSKSKTKTFILINKSDVELELPN